MSPPDLAFYDGGTEPRTGWRRAIVPPRRLLRRILRPCFQRLVVILQHLCARLDAVEQADAQLRAELAQLGRHQAALAETQQSALALGWDHVAMARRLAALEERVEELAARAERTAQPPLLGSRDWH